MKQILLLLAVLTLAACDSAQDGVPYDLTLLTASGDVGARVTFDLPPAVCDGLGCGSGEADWRARDVTDGFGLNRSGRLYAQEVAFGSYVLTFTPEVADDGISAEITEDADGRVTGRWSASSFAGEVDSGRIEGSVR